MRKLNVADVLFTPVKQDILAATYGQPDRWWYLSELASFAGKTPSTLQRELTSLAACGILRTKRDRSRLYFRAEADSPFFRPLKSLVDQALGAVESLRSAIEPIREKIDTAFVYGSVARGDERTQSDVDLIVVGEAGQAELARVLRPLESRFGREFNARCYSPEEFRSKLLEGNHFLGSITNGPKEFIVGGESDLERLAE